MTTDAEISWRGTLLGDKPFVLTKVSGWLGLPGGEYESQDSTRGHGLNHTPVRQHQRVVAVEGFINGNKSTRDYLVEQLRGAMIPNRSDDAVTEPLSITSAGVTRTAEAQLVNFDIPLDVVWRGGVPEFSAQWRCPDPRVFGADISTVAALTTSTSGLTLPRMLPFTMPGQPIGGTVTVSNPGSDPEGSPTVYTLTGAQSGTVGLELVTAGRRVTYALTLGADDVLTIDTERGGAFLNGEYRSSSGMSDLAADLRLLPGVNVVRALGSAGAGSPTIAVTTRPASW